MTEGACICRAVPKSRAAYLILNNEVVHHFHINCPEHGIGPSSFRPMRKVYRRAWINAAQLPTMPPLEEPKIIQKAPNGLSALVEWTDWEFMEEETVTNGS